MSHDDNPSPASLTHALSFVLLYLVLPRLPILSFLHSFISPWISPLLYIPLDLILTSGLHACVSPFFLQLMHLCLLGFVFFDWIVPAGFGFLFLLLHNHALEGWMTGSFLGLLCFLSVVVAAFLWMRLCWRVACALQSPETRDPSDTHSSSLKSQSSRSFSRASSRKSYASFKIQKTGQWGARLSM